MKVRISDLDRELRLMGVVGRIFFTSSPKKMKKLKCKDSKKGQKRYSEKNNRFIIREDGSKLRLLTVESKMREKAKLVPGILWIHGGGLATGKPESYKTMLGFRFLRTNEFVIVAPDYRLSVEAPYPAAIEDCYAALKWVKDNASELGIRDDQIFVGGESAGGGLTVALCMYARDKKEVNIAFQMPLYPMLDHRSNTPSMKDNNAPIWGEALNIVAWKMYLEATTNVISKYASPAIETDYTNLPPAVTFIGSVDAFKDETIQYVENLKNAGIPVEFRIFLGGYHGSEAMVPWAKISKEERFFFQAAFTFACEHYFAAQNNILDHNHY